MSTFMCNLLTLIGKRSCAKLPPQTALLGSGAPWSECSHLAVVLMIILTVDNSPIRSAWLGASRLATNKEELRKVAITRQDYQEYGSAWSVRKFSGGL
jgi:hypothetical protein